MTTEKRLEYQKLYTKKRKNKGNEQPFSLWLPYPIVEFLKGYKNKKGLKTYRATIIRVLSIGINEIKKKDGF